MLVNFSQMVFSNKLVFSITRRIEAIEKSKRHRYSITQTNKPRDLLVPVLPTGSSSLLSVHYFPNTTARNRRRLLLTVPEWLYKPSLYSNHQWSWRWYSPNIKHPCDRVWLVSYRTPARSGIDSSFCFAVEEMPRLTRVPG